MLKIHVLVDNTSGVNTIAEFGLCYLIEFNGRRILFDFGQSNVNLRNAKAMNIDIKNVEFKVLSHGHFDHGNGLEYLNGGTLVCHPQCFVKRYRKDNNSFIGIQNSKEQISKWFNLVTTEEPYQLFDGAVFLGQIPRLTDFESQVTPFEFEDGTPDFVIDDSALALSTDDGLFVITGCGHSGVINTLEHAKKVMGVDKIFGIMGGFHLKENNLQTKETIKYLLENKVTHVIPSHCTTLAAMTEFCKYFIIKEVKTGDTFNF
jgi:7,8-dihydropterin-6-yl-methyl-4-(beta-D-ribofuranosyl)aminobenzene 5'-phosphate synthase